MEQREGRDGGSSRKGGVCHCSIFNCFSTVYTETEIQLLIISSHSVNTDPCSWVRVNSSSPAGLKLFCKTRTFDFLHFFLLNCSVLLSLSPVFVQWYFIIWFIFFLSFLFPPSLCLCRSFRSRRYEPPPTPWPLPPPFFMNQSTFILALFSCALFTELSFSSCRSITAWTPS